ncbi:MAG: DNA repair protein RecO [Firmicutes bacterium]|nr:DNA repair protein RecO [Bacillota bacterium]
MALYRTEAVVLRTHNLGEADKILTLFTRNRGKVRAVARGSRRPRNHLMGVSQLFTHSGMLIFKGKNLDSISQGSIINAWLFLREDLLKMAYASYIVELVDKLTEEYDPNERVYSLLVSVFDQMQKDDLEAILTRFFELHFLRLIGLKPQLERCVGCDTVLTSAGNQLRFSPREGGVLCPNCQGGRSDALSLSQGAYQVMRWLSAANIDRLTVLQMPKPVEQEVEEMLRNFINFHLQRPLKSLEFLYTIRGTS